MMFVKTPRILHEIFKPDDVSFQIALEIFYFADPFSGKINSNFSSLATKYAVQRSKLYRTISKLERTKVVQKREGKGNYYINLDMYHETKADKSETKADKSGTTGEHIKEDKERKKERNTYTHDLQNLLAHYNNTFGRKLKPTDSNLKFYRIALKKLSPEQIKLSHKIIKSKLDAGEWSGAYIAPANLFNTKTVDKRIAEIELHEESVKKYSEAVEYLAESKRQLQHRVETDEELRANYRKLGVEI